MNYAQTSAVNFTKVASGEMFTWTFLWNPFVTFCSTEHIPNVVSQEQHDS